MRKLLPALLALLMLCSPAPAFLEAAPAQSEPPGGFYPATNRTITWCGVDFSVPAYYDTRAEESTETLVEYYSSTDDSYLSLLFQVQPFKGGMADFERALPQMVSEAMALPVFQGSEFHRSEAFTLAGLPGWILGHTGLNMEGAEAVFGLYTFVFHEARGEILMLGFGCDENAEPDYDYLGDFQKIMETARLAEGGAD